MFLVSQSLCYSGRQLQESLLDGDVVKCQQKLHRNGASKDANARRGWKKDKCCRHPSLRKGRHGGGSQTTTQSVCCQPSWHNVPVISVHYCQGDWHYKTKFSYWNTASSAFSNETVSQLYPDRTKWCCSLNTAHGHHCYHYGTPSGNSITADTVYKPVKM